MSQSDEEKSPLSRRRFLSSGLMAAATASLSAGAASGDKTVSRHTIEPFYGKYQSGILTPAQSHTYFAAFDVFANQREDIVQMLKGWTDAAARMSRGQAAEAFENDVTVYTPDSGETLGLPPARLTLTFGFGPGLFVKDGQDRYGLAALQPPALIDLPPFTGDDLIEARTGGDLSVQACADNPQVAFHAVRQLARLAYGAAKIRWVQSGFLPNEDGKQTPRNLMGFKDGTNNPLATDTKLMNEFVWVGDEGPDWMRGGSYLVVRRVRMALERWDRVTVAFQEQTVGRHKDSGAPLGKKHEFDQADYAAMDGAGNPVIPENSHVRLGAAAHNDGARILRRPYSYNDGTSEAGQRWPPSHEEMEYDAGLFFVCYQRDPRTGFVKIFERMSKSDMMHQFLTHTGSGLFACPGGVAKGEFIGQRLFAKT